MQTIIPKLSITEIVSKSSMTKANVFTEKWVPVYYHAFAIYSVMLLFFSSFQPVPNSSLPVIMAMNMLEVGGIYMYIIPMILTQIT